MDQNFATVQAWKDAGSPAGNETNNVTIGGSSSSQSADISPSIQRDSGYAPAISEASDKPDFSAPQQTSQQIQQEYQDAIDYNQRIQSGQESVREDFDWQAQNTSIENIQAKQAAISQADVVEQSYKDSGIDIPKEVQSQLEQTRAAALSPFASMGKEAFVANAVASGMTRAKALKQYEANEGIYSVDVKTAVRAGVGDRTIERLMGEGAGEAIRGAKSYWTEVDTQRTETGDKVRALANLAKYKEGKGYNIDNAIKAGFLGDVQKAGFDSKDIVAAQSRLGISTQAPYLNKGFSMIVPSADEMAKFGFSKSEQEKVKSSKSEQPSWRAYDESTLKKYNPILGIFTPGNPEALFGQRGPMQFAFRNQPIVAGHPEYGYKEVLPITRENIGGSLIFPIIGTEAKRELGYNPSPLEWGISGVATVLNVAAPFIRFPIGKSANIAELSYLKYTGRPREIEVLGQIRELPTTIKIPYQTMGDTRFAAGSARSTISNLPTIYSRNAPSYTVRGESGLPLKIKGVSSLESFGEPLKIVYEKGTGGISIPKYSIPGKKMDIPTKPEWNPGDLSATRETGFYTPRNPKSSGGGTATASALETSRMTPEQAARLNLVESAQSIRIYVPSFYPDVKRTPAIIPITTPRPKIEPVRKPEPLPITAPKPIQLPKISPLTQPTPVTVSEISPGIRTIPSPIPIPIPAPEPTPVPAPIPIPTPSPRPVPAPVKVVTKNPPIIPSKFQTPPKKFIPRPPIDLPKAPQDGGRGRASDRLKRYFLRTYTMPELYVALPTGLLMKPEKLGKRLWKKMIEQPEGVDLTASENVFSGVPGETTSSVETPFGTKDVKIITKSRKVRAGASELARTYKGRELAGTNMGANL